MKLLVYLHRHRLPRYALYAGLILAAGLYFNRGLLWASTDNGFDLADPLVPAESIHAGGPPRDGIPALTDPDFVDRSAADYLAPTDRILGVHLNGQARAYPIRILNYHEIVNDRVGGRPIVVSYCPLCGSGMVFEAQVAGEARTFGVSGLLYNSDLLLYDRQSESLWSQVMAKAIAGPLKGKTLETPNVTHTTWRDWQARYPETRVLAQRTGYHRDYSSNPYPGYAESRALYFPVEARSARYHPKEEVLGVVVDGQAKAYPFSELSQRGGARVSDRLAGQSVTVHFDAENRSARIRGAQGERLHGVQLYWFAWKAFHPETEVYTAP